MQTELGRESIYLALLTHCRSYELPGPWERFGDAEAFCSPEKPAAVLADLEARYSEESLRSSGMVVLDGQGRRILSDALSGPDNIVFALRTGADHPPFDLLTSSGCLSGNRLPLMAALDADHSRSADTSIEKRVFIAFQISDVATLRALGLHATLATGLETLSGEQLREVCERLESDGGAGEPSHRLVLVGWSPSELACRMPDDVRAVRDHFERIEKHLQVSLDMFELWTPTASEVEGIAFCLKNGSVEHVRDAVQMSVDESTSLFVDPLAMADDPVPLRPSLRIAFQALRGTDQTTAPSRPDSDLWSDVEQAVERELIDPILQQALSTNDPLLRSFEVTVAELSRLVHYQILQTTARLSRSIRDSGVNRCEPVSTGELQKLKGLVEQLGGLVGNRPPRNARRPSAGNRATPPGV